MTDNATLDRIRGAALARMERAERARKRLVVAMCVVEGACLLAYFLLADWGDRLHQLIFIAAFLVYATLGIGLFSLGAHVDACTERVLRGLELLGNGGASKGESRDRA